MKKILFILGFISFLTSLVAQNAGFRYQTVLRDATRQYLVDQEVDFKFSILEEDINGIEIYSEEHLNIITNEFGLVNLIIGEGESIDDFTSIPWVGAQYYLRVEIKLEGEDDYMMMGTSPMFPVPLALYEVNDFDRSAVNEIQELFKNGSVIELTDGGSVVLNDDDPNNELITDVILNGSTLEIIDQGGTKSVDLSSLINDADADPSNELQQLTISNHTVSLSQGGGSFSLASYLDSPWSNSFLGIYYPSRVSIGGTSFFSGYDLTVNGNTAINGGILETFSSGGGRLGGLYETVLGGGYFATYGTGANPTQNFVVSSTEGFPNHGYIGVYGPEGQSTGNLPDAGLFVDGNDGGRLFAFGSNGGQKNFVMPHPKLPGKHIWYACIEGPEAAAYERGTAQLINGEAVISFTEHFEIVINPESMTVTLTPLDANSQGLAVVKKTAIGFVVKELNSGSGNYSFDWEAKAVRKGHENYKVVRDAKDLQQEIPKR